MLTDGGGGGTSFEEDLDSVAPRSAPAGASEPPPPGGVGLGIRTVRLFGEAGPAPGVGGGGGGGAGVGDAALDFKLAAAVLRTGGGGGASGSDEDEVSEVRFQDPPLPTQRGAGKLWGWNRAGAALALPGRSPLTAIGLRGSGGSGAGLVLPQLTLQPAVRAGPVPVTSVDPQWGALWSLSFARERGLARPGSPPASPALELGGGPGGRGLARVSALGTESETERLRPRRGGRASSKSISTLGLSLKLRDRAFIGLMLCLCTEAGLLIPLFSFETGEWEGAS